MSKNPQDSFDIRILGYIGVPQKPWPPPLGSFRCLVILSVGHWRSQGFEKQLFENVLFLTWFLTLQNGWAQGQPSELSWVQITSRHFFPTWSLQTKMISKLKLLKTMQNWSQEPDVCLIQPDIVDIILFSSADSTGNFFFLFIERTEWWLWMPGLLATDDDSDWNPPG